MSTETLVIKRVFKLSKRELFDAWSKPEIMSRWFFASSDPGAYSTVDSQFAVKGPFTLTMHVGPNQFVITGRYVEINRYNRIAFTWNSAVVENSLVTLDFKELSPNRSELVLQHNLLPDMERVKLHTQGWEACLENLDKLVIQ